MDFREKPAVWWIIVITSIFFIVEFVLLAINQDFIKYFALSASNFLTGKYPWTIVTHIFSHGGIFHILINMFALFSLGAITERIIGRRRFIWFYLISGVLAGLLSVFLAGFFGFGFLEKIFGSPDIYMLGASGAIFGIAGVLVVLLPKMRFGIIFIPFFSLPGYIMIPLVLVIMWVLSVLGKIPIGNVAHLGGFLTGLVYGFYLRIKYRRKTALLQRYFR
ncbi:rhomboid family intramembrane serine protease [Candidatus Pacearchaeota archaeon]|nr:rhomboid family intramembrane serine protease [Candidatus Pacearchaeota archaeon]